MTALPIAKASRIVLMPLSESVGLSGTTTNRERAYKARRSGNDFGPSVTPGGRAVSSTSPLHHLDDVSWKAPAPAAM
jgi:hypothetical protein